MYKQHHINTFKMHYHCSIKFSWENVEVIIYICPVLFLTINIVNVSRTFSLGFLCYIDIGLNLVNWFHTSPFPRKQFLEESRAIPHQKFHHAASWSLCTTWNCRWACAAQRGHVIHWCRNRAKSDPTGSGDAFPRHCFSLMSQWSS